MGGLNRTKRISPCFGLPALQRGPGVGRQIAGKDGELLVAVERAPADGLAGQRIADDARQRLAVPPRLAFARRADRRHRQHIDLRAAKLGARHGPAGEPGEDRFEPVVALLVEMVGLGGGEHDAVDARGEQARPQAVRPGSETFEDLGHGALEIGHGGLTAVQRREHVDQHDLAIEPREMIAEEGPHHMRFIGLVAPLHHRPERARAKLSCPPGSSGAKVSAGEPARSPGMRKRPGGSVESACGSARVSRR